MIVKVCGITNLDDALGAVHAGASAIGFNFYRKSPRYIAPESAAAIARELPGGVLRVGVFVNEAPETVLSTAAQAGLDIAQLHGDEGSAGLPAGVRIWKAFRVTDAFDASVLDAYAVEAFLLDGPAPAYGGGGAPFDWAAAAGLKRRIILAGGLGPDNVAEAIRAAAPWGVDACSRLESSPGRKDASLVRAFVAAARNAWKQVA